MNIDKRKLWTKRIQDYRTSGLTAAKWCEKNEISIHTLKYWITKFNKEKNQESKKTKWTTIIPAESKTESLKVIIGHSTIELAPGFDSETFKKVVRILNEQC